MICILYILSLLSLIYGFTPECSKCKHFIPNNNSPVFGLCNMFQDSVYINNEKTLSKNLAIHCRNDESLCGKNGFLFEPIQSNDVKKRFEDYEYMKTICSQEYV